MSTVQNKQTAKTFLEVMSAHEDMAWLEDNMCDDATYWTCGKPHLFDYAGTRDKRSFIDWARHPSIFIDGGSKVSYGKCTAEGDRVALESQTRGTLPDLRVYTNEYHYLFTFRDGKVLAVKEYMDTQAAAEFFAK
jgi:ketosteroid isomerase-like protein